MYKDKINGVVIGDIHWNAFHSSKLYDELSIFLDELDRDIPIDLLVIDGDYWDCKTSLTESAAYYGTKFMQDDIVKRAREKGFPIRIIKGTKSHDNNQLDVFMSLQGDRSIDFRIIDEVTSEELFPGFKVLYIPEEYIKDKKEHYGKYFNKTYDMVFGHGLFDEAIPFIKDQTSELPIRNAPIFTVGEMKAISKGGAIFAHVHKPVSFDNFVHYTSSYSRWVHGEEDDKGFIRFEYDMQNPAKITRVNNTKARLFTTKDLDSILNHMHPEDIIKEILALKERLGIYSLRVKLRVKANDDKGLVSWTIVKDYFARNKQIKILMSVLEEKAVRKDNIKDIAELEDDFDSEMKRYWFLFDRTVEFTDKVHQYLIEKGTPIERDTLQSMLECGKLDVLNELMELQTKERGH